MTSASPGLDGLPPVMQLLIREASIEDKSDLLKRLDDLIPELQRQAHWSLTDFEYADLRAQPDFKKLTVGLVEGLDPFTPHCKCGNPRCRIQLAQQIGRSVGIYADRVLVTDLLTDTVARTERWTREAIVGLATEALVLLSVRPLLEAGVFHFFGPYFSTCIECKDAFDSKVESTTMSLVEHVESEVSYEVEGKRIIVMNTGTLFDERLMLRARLSKKDRGELKKGVPLDVIGYEKFAEWAFSHIAATLNSIRFTSNLGGTTFANSRVGLMAARSVDGRLPAYQAIKNWEARRSATLPWIGHLSMEQVLRLRDEADLALPRFRERLSRIMASAEEQQRDAERAIADLAEEAVEVEQELRNLNLPSRERFRRDYGLLGLTLSLYGFASEILSPGMAVGGLYSLLHLLHQQHTNDTTEHDRWASQPGYVLVKAKEIVQHAIHED